MLLVNSQHGSNINPINIIPEKCLLLVIDVLIFSKKKSFTLAYPENGNFATKNYFELFVCNFGGEMITHLCVLKPCVAI